MNISEIPTDGLFERILGARRMSRKDQALFMSALLSKKSLSDKEQRQVNQVYEALRSGRIRVVD